MSEQISFIENSRIPEAPLSKKKSRILIIDDDPDNRKLVSDILEWANYEILSTVKAEEALQMMENEHPDLIFLDIGMPGLNALETVPKLRSKNNYTSLIFLSAKSDVNDVIKGLDLGADDYISKPFDPRELLARTRCQLRIKQLHDDLKKANEKLQELINIDDLTGLYNMRSLYSRLDQEINRALRFGRYVSVLMMDMDHFKNVNDQHDHLFGSFVLSEIGHLIKKNIRRIDFAARYGGDEFLIALTETDMHGTQFFAERLREKIANHIFTNGKDTIQLTASIGFSIMGPNNEQIDARELVRSADRALYRAKNSGRNCIYFNNLSVKKRKKS